MRERHFPRPRAQSAADQRRHAGGMMRRAERAAIGERAALDLARDRGDHRDLEQFRRRQRRQDGRQPRGQHRLAGAGRSDHEHGGVVNDNFPDVPALCRCSWAVLRREARLLLKAQKGRQIEMGVGLAFLVSLFVRFVR